MFKRLQPLQDAVGDAERRFTPAFLSQLSKPALTGIIHELEGIRETILIAFRQQAAIKVRVYNPAEMLDTYHALLSRLDRLLLLVEFWKPVAGK